MNNETIYVVSVQSQYDGEISDLFLSTSSNIVADLKVDWDKEKEKGTLPSLEDIENEMMTFERVAISGEYILIKIMEATPYQVEMLKKLFAAEVTK